MGRTNFTAQNSLLQIIRDGRDIDGTTGEPLLPRRVRELDPSSFSGMTPSGFRNALKRLREQVADEAGMFVFFF